MSRYQLYEHRSFKIISRDGVSLFSKYNPPREADRIIERCVGETEPTLIIILSVGNPYLIDAVNRRFPGSRKVIVEKDPRLSSFIKENWGTELSGLPLFSGVGEGELPDKIADEISFEDRISFVFSENVIREDAEYYNSVIRTIQNIISFKQKNFETICQFGRDWTRQIIRNLYLVGETRSLRDLIDRLREIPNLAVAVIGAGPSLNELCPLLESCGDKLLLLVVDTAIPVLEKNGIEPDFIFSGDTQSATLRHFSEAKFSGKGRALVAAPCVYTEVIELGWDEIFFFHYPHPVLDWAGDPLRECSLKTGGSISVTAFDFARKLAPSAIFLLGQDYSYRGLLTHSKGTMYESRNISRFYRFFSPADDIRECGRYRWESPGESDRFTLPNLVEYRNYLDREIRSCGIPVYDLSQGILREPSKISAAVAANMLAERPVFDKPNVLRSAIETCSLIDIRKIVERVEQGLRRLVRMWGGEGTGTKDETDLQEKAIAFLTYSVQEELARVRNDQNATMNLLYRELISWGAEIKKLKDSRWFRERKPGRGGI